MTRAEMAERLAALEAEAAALRAASLEVVTRADKQRKARNDMNQSSGITIGLDRALDTLRPLVGAPPVQHRQV